MNLKTTYLRCTNCGSRTEVPARDAREAVPRTMTMAAASTNDVTNADPMLDDIAVELAAMQAIARALASIRNSETRQRVVMWATERFRIPTTFAAPARPTAPASIADDPALAVETLYDLFDHPRTTAAMPASQAMQIALAETEDDTLTLTDLPPQAAAAPAQAHDATTPREEPALDTLVKGFANELQRLAVEWQTV